MAISILNGTNAYPLQTLFSNVLSESSALDDSSASTNSTILNGSNVLNGAVQADDNAIPQRGTLDAATAAQRALTAFQQSAPGDAASTTAISGIGRALATGDFDAVQDAYTVFQDESLNDPLRPPIGALQQNTETNVRSLFEQLSEALTEGDLNAAQDAFDELEALAPPVTDDNPIDNTNPFGDDVDALDQALSAGDLEAARNAFAQLQEEIENNPPPRPSNGFIGNDELPTLFSQLGNALDSNDLTGAQESFRTLIEELQAQQQSNPYSQVDNLTNIGGAGINISA